MQTQVRACTAATLLAALPSMVHQMLRPSRQGLLLAMANSAFAFFLFSFQVRCCAGLAVAAIGKSCSSACELMAAIAGC